VVSDRLSEARPAGVCVRRSPRSWCDRSGTKRPLEKLCTDLNRGGRAPRLIPPHMKALWEARSACAPKIACMCGRGGPKEARPTLAGENRTLRLRSGRRVAAAHTQDTNSGGRDASLWPLPSMNVRGERNKIQHDCLVASVSRDNLERLDVTMSTGVVHRKSFPFLSISEPSRPFNDRDASWLTTMINQLIQIVRPMKELSRMGPTLERPCFRSDVGSDERWPHF